MRLWELKTGDRFYLHGKKLQVFFTLRFPTKPYAIPCIEWPLCANTYGIHSETIVKPILRAYSSAGL